VTQTGAARTRAQSAATSTFSRFASATARWAARPEAFLLAAAIVVAWALTGPYFHYSDGWELVITTGATIVTFLMVFLIQNSQNRDTLAVQLKLDELILATRNANSTIAAIQDRPDEHLHAARSEIRGRVASNAREEELGAGGTELVEGRPVGRDASPNDRAEVSETAGRVAPRLV
jgi:low affinity Fe/Cu permease